MSLSLGLGLALTRNKGGGYPGAFNVTAAWKAAVKTNWATKDIVVSGDSTSRGFGAGEDVSGVNNQAAYAWPSALKTRLQARGYSASRDSVFGGGVADTTSNFLLADSRITFGAGWGLTISPTETAGGTWFINSTDTSAIVVTPTDPWDQVYVYYRRNTGVVTLQVDSGGLTTLDTAPGVDSRQQVYSLSTTLGSHSFTIARVSGAAQIGGIEFRNTANARKQIINLARAGAAASNAAKTSVQAGPLPSLGKILEQRTAPLVCVDYGINDENGGVTTGPFKTDMQSIISLIVSKGGTPLLVGHNATSTTPGAAYIQAHRELAMTNGIPFFNLAALYSWSQIQANGWNFDGSSHLNAAGYAAMAAKIDDFLAWAVR